MRLPQGFEWLIIVAIVLLLFGAKRMPDAARGLGRSLRIFKAETKGLTDDAPKPEDTPPAAVTPAPIPAPTPIPAPAPIPEPAPIPVVDAVPPAPKDATAPERTEG